MHLLSIARTLVFVVCSASLPAALAETVPPRDPEAAARAAREAVNPLRAIIEASKLKVRIKPDNDGPDSPSTDKRPLRVTKPVAKVAAPPAVESAKPAPRQAATPAAAAESAKLAPRPAATPAATPPATAESAQPAPRPAATQAAVANTKAPDSSESRPHGPALVESHEGAMPTASVSAPAAALPQLRRGALLAQPLKLAQMVEPTLSKAAMRSMTDDVEVVVGFTVNTDGSVSDVVIRANPVKALDAAVVEAVSQWRYEPIREARVHAVRLVLSPEN